MVTRSEFFVFMASFHLFQCTRLTEESWLSQTAHFVTLTVYFRRYSHSKFTTALITRSEIGSDIDNINSLEVLYRYEYWNCLTYEDTVNDFSLDMLISVKCFSNLFFFEFVLCVFH